MKRGRSKIKQSSTAQKWENGRERGMHYMVVEWK